MDRNEYIKLLQRSRESLPKDISKNFRFEVPKISSFIQGNKTIITNWSDITKKIRRDEHVRKIVAQNLATSASENKKQLVLLGKFSKELLNKQLKDYTIKYVICSECSRPDTNLIKNGRIWTIICEACGARHSVK